MLTEKIRQAAAYIRHADALIITAGAGIGIDSGLPDFRGIDGFWRAFPPLRRLGKNFHPPEKIPEIIVQFDAGYDVVTLIRTKNGKLFKKAF